jgi:hypothetical protein
MVVHLDPKSAIESPILDRFADMFAGDLITRLQIGDRARHFQDPVVSASAQIQLRHRHANWLL